MLSAVLLVSKETLEASFYISLTLIYSGLLKINTRWLFISLVLAIISSLLLANNMQHISDWYGGIGQEIIHGISLIVTALSIMLLNGLVCFKAQRLKINEQFFGQYQPVSQLKKDKTILTITLLMSFCLINVVAIETSEIIIYYLSAIQQETSATTAATATITIGALLGTGIGLSIGIISYYTIHHFVKYQLYIVLFLLSFVAAGMLAQAIAFMSQAGLVDLGKILWDSNFLINENSLLGQLMYALFGYESTPTLTQVLIYLSSLFISLTSLLFIFIQTNKKIEP